MTDPRHGHRSSVPPFVATLGSVAVVRSIATLRSVAFALLAAAATVSTPADAAGQPPLGINTARGQTVTPVYEGWYHNPDGSFSLSFGYFNRNFGEVVDVPLGEANFIEPASFDGRQPTTFHPRRHWGVFTVTVPADFADGQVVWTIDIRGERNAIPGHLHADWEIDALVGEAGSGNTPPVLSFDAGASEGAGPGGPTAPPMVANAGEAIALEVWTRDDGKGSGSVRGPGRSDVPVTLTWFKHSGPGEVTFSEESGEVPVEGGSMTTMAVFSDPGDYVVRVRANDASGVSGAGHAQCCWTNGYVRVEVR